MFVSFIPFYWHVTNLTKQISGVGSAFLVGTLWVYGIVKWAPLYFTGGDTDVQ